MIREFIGRAIRIALVAVPALAMVITTAAETNPPLAVLLNCQGEVVVIRAGGEKIAGTFGLHLNAGDEVSTGDDGSAEILFQDNNLVQIGAGSRMTVKGQEPAGGGSRLGGKSFESVNKFLKLKDGTSIAQLRSGEGGNDVVAEYPRQTRVRETHPTFRWSSEDAASELELKLYNDAGVVWQQTIAGATSIAYPEAAPALEPDVEYSWTLESTDPLQFPPVRTQAVFFRVLGVDDATAVDAALAEADGDEGQSEVTRRLRRASIFYDHGLLDSAIAETRHALNIDPSSPTLRSILAHLYAEVGRTGEAIGEYNQLLEHK